MTNLVLQDFTCIEETDEAGWDSPYFVIFVGHPGSSALSDVRTVRKESWDNNIGSGSVRIPNLTVASGVNSNTLVLVALIEEDVNPDITGSSLAHVQRWMNAVFGAFGQIGGISLNQLELLVGPEFERALNANIANDDIVAVHRLGIGKASGVLPQMHFWGAGGHYAVRFRME